MPPKLLPLQRPQSQQRAPAAEPMETSQIFASLPPIQTHQCYFPDSLVSCPLLFIPNAAGLVLSLVISHRNDLEEPRELSLFK